MNHEKKNTNNIEELSYEQLNKFIYYTSQDHLYELKELTRKTVKVRFVRKMRIYINKSLCKLEQDNNIKIETVNLYKQAQKNFIECS